MKILHVIPFINPGSGLGKYVLNLSSVLSDKGHEMGVITTHTTDAGYEIDQLHMHNIKCIGQLGAYSKVMRYSKLIRLINRNKPDVLIVNYDGTAQFILPFINNDIKVIHVLHNNTDDFYRIGSINAYRVDGWIAPTEAIADNFNKYTGGKYADKVKVIAHGVELPTESKMEKSSKPELIFVGVHYEHKGVKILPDLIMKLQSLGMDFHFTIVGNGELTEWLKDSLHRQTTEGVVTFTGVIPAAEVYALQSKADIFVYPTHIDAFGLVIAEAMINGTVPVVTELKGITDNLIADGVNGYLLPQDDVDAFVGKITTLINNPEQLMQFKKQATASALEKFTLAKMGDNYDRYLRG